MAGKRSLLVLIRVLSAVNISVFPDSAKQPLTPENNVCPCWCPDSKASTHARVKSRSQLDGGQRLPTSLPSQSLASSSQGPRSQVFSSSHACSAVSLRPVKQLLRCYTRISVAGECVSAQREAADTDGACTGPSIFSTVAFRNAIAI